MAAVNLPDNPANGTTQTVGGITYTYNSSKGYWTAAASSGGGGGGGASVTTDDSAPGSPSDGDLWYDTDDGGMFVYYQDADSSQWVEVIGSQGAPGAAGAAGADGGAGVASVYATVDALPTSGNSQGDMAHVTANNTLYFWNGSGWYKIALINTNPSISGVSSSYSLAIDGTATTVTMTATDPEGLPITYSIASDTSGNIATVSQGTGASTNVFTITPSTSTANAGSFTLTFRASDGVNVATAPATFTLQFSVSNSRYTTALITSVGANNAVNNSFDDKSTSDHTITANGNVTQTTFSPYRHGGYSTYFDGSGDYIDWPAHADFNLGTGDFTIEGWVQTGVTSNDYYYRRIFMLDGPTGNNNSNIQLGFDGTTGKFNMWSNTGAVDVLSGAGFNDNAWHHFAVVRNSNTLTLWVDGSSAGTADASSYTFSPNSGTPRPRIASYNQTQGDFLGYIRDFRIVKGTAVYTSAFNSSLPSEPLTAITNTSLLTCHLPYIADGSTTGHTPTVGGSTSTQPLAPYDGQEYSASSHLGSASFDGSGDYLSAPDSDDWHIGASDFTIEGWIYKANDGSHQSLLSNRASGSNEWRVLLDYTTSYSEGAFRFDWGSSYQTWSNADIQADTWTHFAVTRSGTTGTLYINGVSKGDKTLSDIGNISGSLIVGSNDGSGEYYKGNVADLRIVKGTAVYTSNFTPPTAPLTAITNTVFLLQNTDAGIIDKSQTSLQLVLEGDTKCSSTQTKYRSTAVYTDGTGDRIKFGISNDIVCNWGDGGQPFTVEWWQYDEMPSSTNHMVGPCCGGGAGAWNSTNGHQFMTFFYSSTFYLQYYGTNNSHNTVTGTPSTMGFVQNQWQHCAHTFDGTTWKFYVDGTEALSSTLGNTPQSIIAPFISLGAMADSTYYTSAYYDDVRITKGLVRYTANFTAPTAALKG